MNIFATYPCPVKSARVLDDQRVVKMILESCQLMSNGLRHNGVDLEGLPRKTHFNHPCSLWVAEGRDNFDWLLEHAVALDTERKARWGRSKDHKTLRQCLDLRIHRYRKRLPRGGSTHVNCAANEELGLNFKHIDDVHRAYKLYLMARWRLQQQAYPEQRLPFATIVGYLK